MLTSSSLLARCSLQPACPWAARLQQLGSGGRGALQSRRAALAPLPDHDCSASQRSQTSAVHRHGPTQTWARWRTSEKPLFHRKIPFRHLLFLILIAEFRLEKFLTARAVSWAWAVFPGQHHRVCLKCFSIPNKQDTCSATGVRNRMQQGLEL